MSGHASTARAGLMIVTALLLLAGTATEGQRWTSSTDALGQSRPAGRLLEQVRAGNALRAARGVRGTATRGHQGRRAGRARARAGDRGAAERAVHRRRPGGRQLRRRARLLRPVRGGQGQPALARCRSARRARSRRCRRKAGRRRRHGGGARGPAARPRAGRLVRGPKPVRPLHHARAARLDDAGQLRQFLPDRPGVPATSPSPTRWCTRRAIIPLDGRAPLARSIRQYMGDARGHWDGDTLVVETTNFRDEPAYRGSNPDDAAADRALHCRRRRQGRVVGHRRRSNDMDAAVDVRDAADAERQGGRRRVRVPRGQPGDVARARRRARGRESRGRTSTRHRGHSFDGTAHPHSGGHHQPVVCLGGYVGDDGRRTRRRSWKLRRLLSRVAARDHGDVHRGDGR